MKMKKSSITDMHGETKKSLKNARIKYRMIPKAESKINVILQCVNGHGVLEICKLLDMSDKTVSKYIRQFNEGGLEEVLKIGKSTGHPFTLTEEERKIVEEALLFSTPKELDCGESVNWTSAQVRVFIQNRFGKDMCNVGIQKMLHKMGFSFTRPTYVLAKADKKNC